MEKERAYRSVGVFAYNGKSAFSPIFVTAAISALALLAVAGWQLERAYFGADAASGPVAASGTEVGQGADTGMGDVSVLPPSNQQSTATSSDDISPIGIAILDRLTSDYLGLQQLGIYSSSTAEAAAKNTLSAISSGISYPTYKSSDLVTDRDTSYARMLAYRSDLRDSLSALLKNTQPEYELFGAYVQTNDASYLAELKAVAENYRVAAQATVKVVVPADAAPYHLAILNAMREFAAVLDAMSAQASDPFAVAVLLKSYNAAEANMLTSFNALTTYYKSKHP